MEDSSVDDFECQCRDEFRSACKGLPFYADAKGKRYCVLHYPRKAKEETDPQFQEALERKKSDLDFDFAGVYFSSVPDYFAGFEFKEYTTFRGATFSEIMDFSEATFSKEADFRTATFKERAAFLSLRTLPRTVFLFWHVTTEKPERISFHTTHLRPSWFIDVDAQKFDFSDVEWFRIPNTSEPDTDKLGQLKLEDEIERIEELENDENKSPQILRKQSLRKLTKACTRLMNNAEENRDYPTANEFHYWSMETRRKEGWTHLGLIATLYWALSGYGERPRRAFWVLVAIWLAFAALYLLIQSSPFLVFGASDVWQGIDYARQAAVYSLSAMARLNPRPPTQALDWFQTLVTVEGILGPLQIALFLLAVRRRVMR